RCMCFKSFARSKRGNHERHENTKRTYLRILCLGLFSCFSCISWFRRLWSSSMDSLASRRQFLAALGPAAAGILASEKAEGAAVPVDAPRDLKPTAANLGSLFPDVAKLAADNRYTYSFLGDRFKTLEEFKKAGREKVFEAARYRPEKVE